MLIRHAQYADLKDITQILNETIRQGPSTAQIDLVSLENRVQWFEAQDRARFPVLVAEREGGLAGYLSLNPYRPGRRALEHTVEVSYFVHPEHQRQGVASRLMDEALALCPHLGISSLIAILLETNQPSYRFLETFSFQRWGTLPGIAEINGKTVGQYYYGRNLQSDL